MKADATDKIMGYTSISICFTWMDIQMQQSHHIILSNFHLFSKLCQILNVEFKLLPHCLAGVEAGHVAYLIHLSCCRRMKLNSQLFLWSWNS